MNPILDISEFQPYVTYSLAAQFLSGVILRVGGTYYGTGASSYYDRAFETHYNGFLNKLPIGAYWLAAAVTDEGVLREVRMTLEVLKDKAIQLPVYYDIEISQNMGAHGKLSKSERTRLALLYCRKIEEAGFKAGIYTGVSFVKNMLDMDQFNDFSIWIAQYNSFLQYDGKVDFWQYTSEGTIPGINARVDLSKVLDQKPKEKPIEEPIPARENTYTVKAGDTLSSIAQKFGTTYQKIASLNGISNPNLIFVGDVLKLPAKETEKETEKEPVKEPEQKTYTVQSGDTLWSIASKFNTTISQIAKDNGIENPNLIYPGTVLKL